MLKKKKQDEYFKKRWNSVLFHLQAFREYGDTEELHRVRVDIKRMKALLLLDEKQFEGKKFQHHFKRITELFKQAGKVRTAQVNLELMDHYQITNEKTEKEQTEILVRESEKLFSDLDRYLNFLKSKPTFFLNHFSKMENREIRHKVKRQLGQLNKTFHHHVPAEELHECRKLLKRLIYVHDILPTDLINELNLRTEYLKKLEELIGKWHDTIVAIELVGKNAKDKNLIHKIHSEGQKQLKAIHVETKNFKQKSFIPIATV